MDGMVGGPLYARLFACAPVYDLVFSCLSPRSLIRFALTCRDVYLAVAEFKTRAFNINRHLSRYFTDPIAFRSLQARTNTLISGSNALQFLDRTFYPEADLDLYTHPGHSFEVTQFLVKAQGYRYVPRESQVKDWKMATNAERDLTARRVQIRESPLHWYPTTHIRAVWSFEKTGSNEERLIVQIIEAWSSPLESILGFHSTCVMNLISSDAAYSLYPIATFENRSTLVLPSPRSSTAAMQKYAKRGWRVYYLPTPRDRAFLLDQARWVSDKHTWRVPLDQTGVQERPPLSRSSAPLPYDPVLFNGWKFKPHKGEEECDFKVYRCHYYPLKSTLFRYNYALPDEGVQFTIRDWAQHQGNMTHLNISKEDWAW
ncbi:hypothetical protein V8E55_012063 [Tylopilus felleus]